MPTPAKCFAKKHVGSSLHHPFSTLSDTDKQVDLGQERAESAIVVREMSDGRNGRVVVSPDHCCPA